MVNQNANYSKYVITFIYFKCWSGNVYKGYDDYFKMEVKKTQSTRWIPKWASQKKSCAWINVNASKQQMWNENFVRMLKMFLNY